MSKPMNTRLIPPTTDLSQPYWDAARRGELVLQHCEECGHTMFPPCRHCQNCQSARLEWKPVSGKGTVYTYTVAKRPPHAILAEQCPLAIAVVELEEGPRMITNVVGCDPSEINIGMAVRVDFETIEDSDMVLPVFSPA